MRLVKPCSASPVHHQRMPQVGTPAGVIGCLLFASRLPGIHSISVNRIDVFV
jgi:hypothetical protein